MRLTGTNDPGILKMTGRSTHMPHILELIEPTGSSINQHQVSNEMTAKAEPLMDLSETNTDNSIFTRHMPSTIASKPTRLLHEKAFKKHKFALNK